MSISALCLTALTQISASMTAAGVAGGASGLATEVIGSRLDSVLCATAGQFIRNIREPVNHDLLKGMIAAHGNAFRHYAETLDGQATATSRPIADKIIALAKKDIPFDMAPTQALMASVTPLLAGAGDETIAARRGAFISAAVAALVAWIETETGEVLPPCFVVLLTAAAPNGRESWEAKFQLHLAETIKTNIRYSSIFIASNIAELVGRAVTIEQLADGLVTSVAELRGEVGAVKADTTRILELQTEGITDHAVTHKLLAQVLTLVGQTSLPDHAIREAVARFIVLQPHAGTNEIVSAIGNFERDYRALEAQVAAITILDNHVQSIKVKAEEALAAGDLDSARICYGDAKVAARDKASEPVRTAAELASAEASVHLLALDWMAADKAWTEAELMLAPFDMVASSELAHKSAQKLFDFGDRHAEIGPLDASAMRWELLGNAAEQLGEKKGAALYKDCAGVALRKRAERSSGELAHELFAKSALLHEAACKANHRIETPVEWSLAQHNLGTCLDFWAKLLDGQKGRNLLIKAISAFRECLRARPKKTMLLERLKTQNNLGNALWELGERTPGDAGIKLLRQAIATHRTVLRSRKRMDHAGFWAQSKLNIGIAIYSLGKRLSGVESKHCLENAVANFRSALGARDETKNPVLWALTQNNLALALIDFAKKSDDRIAIRSLTDAIAACNFALSVRTESAMPSHWAKTQCNFGLANLELAKRSFGEKQNELLGKAITAFKAALRVHTQKHFPLDYSRSNCGLAESNALIMEAMG